jgi:hypothetical protein
VVRDTSSYEGPTVTDHGDLRMLTAACIGDGSLDEAFKGDTDPFQSVSPAFGDPSFCTP